MTEPATFVVDTGLAIPALGGQGYYSFNPHLPAGFHHSTNTTHVDDPDLPDLEPEEGQPDEDIAEVRNDETIPQYLRFFHQAALLHAFNSIQAKLDRALVGFFRGNVPVVAAKTTDVVVAVFDCHRAQLLARMFHATAKVQPPTQRLLYRFIVVLDALLPTDAPENPREVQAIAVTLLTSDVLKTLVAFAGPEDEQDQLVHHFRARHAGLDLKEIVARRMDREDFEYNYAYVDEEVVRPRVRLTGPTRERAGRR
ncbi:hypothetical protein FA15DRAFT_676609 [Coprinopsis marcescibilis]|uniref:Uncharacterized protein n=1 Tax=Coprinopsis marcescibilis TaxID=230819 RepID=A0A5C3K9C9_COPMA|nr:hypothetical protein FA15DRAFT_676609 [Coprinopsis marcescibilis]